MARREGVGRVVHLGEPGDRPQSEHLRSRAATAELLAEHGPPLTYFRASMVVGPESESYRTLRGRARQPLPHRTRRSDFDLFLFDSSGRHILARSIRRGRHDRIVGDACTRTCIVVVTAFRGHGAFGVDISRP